MTLPRPANLSICPKNAVSFAIGCLRRGGMRYETRTTRHLGCRVKVSKSNDTP